MKKNEWITNVFFRNIKNFRILLKLGLSLRIGKFFMYPLIFAVLHFGLLFARIERSSGR